MNKVDGVILAAGRSSRMGSVNKAQASLGGQPLLQAVVARVKPQVRQLLINGDPAICGEQAVADRVQGFQGPLAGLYSARCSDRLSTADYLLLVPCDGPFVPTNLASELYVSTVQAAADVACVRYQGVAQPTFSLWHKRVLPEVKRALVEQQQGGFKPLLQRLHTAYVDWPEQQPNPFFNINTRHDLALAETMLCP